MSPATPPASKPRARWASWLDRALLLGWEMPQNLLGLAALGAFGLARQVEAIRFERERVLVEIRSVGAVSLGLFVFFTRRDNRYVPVGAENLDHEYGHSIQSRWLGPLYLLVVGLPSEARVIYAIAYRRLHGRRWSGYYDGFPEKQADELGGADRSQRPAA